jgi:predicted NBD/HSP70 family sugar kinase
MSGDRCADCGRRETVCQHCSRDEIVKLRAEVEALRGERDEARDELAAVIKGKDILADALCKVLGMSPSTLTKAVNEAVARLTPALRSAPPGAP